MAQDGQRHAVRAMDVSVATRAGDRSDFLGPIESTPGLVEQLVGAGVLDRTAAARGALTFHDESRTNSVCRFDLDGVPFAYAKQRGWAARLDADDPVTAERTALTQLSRSDIVPTLLPIDSPNVLWTRALQPCRPLHELLVRVPRAELVMALKAWGSALAALHRWPTRFGSPPQAQQPWILGSSTIPAHLRALRTAGPRSDESASTRIQALVGKLRSNPAVIDALAEVTATWTARHWTHADMTTANAVANRSQRYRWRVWLVDFEAAGLGDPRWDLATAYDSLLLHRATLGRHLRPSLQALLDGYRRADGPATLSPAHLIARSMLTQVQVAAASCQRPTGASWGGSDPEGDGHAARRIA
ncbi:phosphotransferase [Jatrophihabitans sp. DSM 45814]